MKEFNSKIERDFLKILSKIDKKSEVNLATYLSECILKNDRLIDIGNEKISLIFNTKKENVLTFMKDLTIIISLIEILKDEKIIFTHTNPRILKLTTEPTQKQNRINPLTNDKNIQNKIQNSTDYGKWELPTTLSGYIFEYINEFCYVRPELTEYINNDFSTPEQIRFKKTLLWTRIATLISFVGLLIAITIPFLAKTDVYDIHEMNKTDIKTKEIIKDTLLNKQLDTTLPTPSTNTHVSRVPDTIRKKN
ncbi:hypothetical protein [Leptobacterium sp. I13]|uniref:hypothetical protein n=1 Tax=Leptobacterium meishanense TaxID=3128904 RepID=UPI0030EF07AA